MHYGICAGVLLSHIGLRSRGNGGAMAAIASVYEQSAYNPADYSVYAYERTTGTAKKLAASASALVERFDTEPFPDFSAK